MSLGPERLHVVRCYDRLPPLAGGMERHIAELTAAQRALGVRVTEVFNGGEPQGESVQLWAGRRLHQLRPYLLRSALFYAAAAHRHFDFSDGHIHVVHIHGDWPAFFLGSLFGRSIGADAVAASLHSTTHAPIHRYRFALRRCEPVFTTGAKEARVLSQALGRPVLHLPSAPNDLFFGDAPGRDLSIDVVAVGSLVPVKNLGLLLECAARRSELSFGIVGDGPDGPALCGRTKELGLGNVRFFGALGPQQVRSVLQSARLFVNTSLTEGSPTAVLEAMASGLPVVLTPSNDYSNIIDEGVNGYVSRGWEPDDFVQAIDAVLRDPTFMDRARPVARRMADNHRWPVKARIVTEAMLAAADWKRVTV